MKKSDCIDCIIKNIIFSLKLGFMSVLIIVFLGFALGLASHDVNKVIFYIFGLLIAFFNLGVLLYYSLKDVICRRSLYFTIPLTVILYIIVFIIYF